MPRDRDGRHEGGSIVDTTRANMSPEQINAENERRERRQRAEEQAGPDQQQPPPDVAASS